ncbi:MAG: amidohydrolase [candidate division NC10 bacterium]|nr:amidohydrolase [candidate division NC10 bacterium]
MRGRWGRAGRGVLLLGVLLAAPVPGTAEAPLPLVDLHIHYNAWVAASLTPEEAARRLREHGAIGGVVSSTPTPNALRLAARAPGALVPFFRPYLTAGHRGSWHQDPAVLKEAEAALTAGQYRGIGEVHLSAGNAGADASNAILRGLLDLARRHRVPVQVHVDAPDIPVLEALLAACPTVPVIWAHAGGWAEPGQVEAVLINHPNLWVEFSTRDPFRYGSVAPLVEASGGLKPGWAALARRFPDRLMVGSDTGTVADWDRLGELYAFHRAWLAGLPRDVAEAIAFRNAARLLGLRLPATVPQP